MVAAALERQVEILTWTGREGDADRLARRAAIVRAALDREHRIDRPLVARRPTAATQARLDALRQPGRAHVEAEGSVRRATRGGAAALGGCPAGVVTSPSD